MAEKEQAFGHVDMFQTSPKRERQMNYAQADLLESISETRYLSADNYRVYRTVMRIFYLEHQKMHYQMDRDTVLALLWGQSVFADYTPEQLTLDLQQLVKWKNLTPIQDPRKPRTIAEFKNKQYQSLRRAAIKIRSFCLFFIGGPPFSDGMVTQRRLEYDGKLLKIL